MLAVFQYCADDVELNSGEQRIAIAGRFVEKDPVAARTIQFAVQVRAKPQHLVAVAFVLSA